MKRRPDWQQCLTEAVAVVAGRRFAWGGIDCVGWVNLAVLSMTGESLRQRRLFEDRDALVYDDRESAGVVLARLGCRDVGDLAAKLLEEIPPFVAGAGDVAAVEDGAGSVALGIVQGPTAVYVMRPTGLGLADRGQVLRAFRVP